MKQTTVSFLIALCIFYWGGYRVLFYFMEQRSNANLISKIDRQDYAEEDLFELSIPLELPYQTEQTEFQRIDGDIVIDGEYFHYVKRKVSGNCLIIKCVRNPEKTRIKENVQELDAALNDNHNAGSAKSNGLFKLVKAAFSEYHPVREHLQNPDGQISRILFILSDLNLYQSRYIPIHDIPPEEFPA